MTLVLGGGIGGLASSYYLAKLGRKVTLLEGGSRLGGWIRTINDPKTGVQFDKGPRTLRVKGPPAINTLRLIEELGLSNRLLPISTDHPSAKNRMIYVNDQLHLLPTSFSSIFKKTKPFSKPLVASIMKDLTSPSKIEGDDNVYDFVERRFGTEIADYLISSMICGICAGDAKRISVKFLMPQLFEMEQTHGSVVKGLVKNMFRSKAPKTSPSPGSLEEKAIKEKWNIFGFQGGMETFPKALESSIVSLGVDVQLNSEITQIQLCDKSIKCHIGDKCMESEHLISSLPANKLGKLLKESSPHLSEELASIPFVDVAVVNLAFKGKVLAKEAFGFLIPPSQNKPILGVIFDSCNFDAGDWTVLTVMMGGARFDKYFGPKVDDEELLNVAVTHTKEILNIDSSPEVHHVSVMKDCIPQYVVGHYDRVSRIQSYIVEKELPISLVGSSYTGVGVNDVILSARKAAESIK